VVTSQQTDASDRSSTLRWYGGLLVAVGALSTVMLPGVFLLISLAILIAGGVMAWLGLRGRRTAVQREDRDS
jgi:hypothetical protein